MIQMIDTQTGKTIVPLAKELGLEPYKQYQAGALESGMGLAIHLSYRQASSEVIRIRGQGPGKSTLYRWFGQLSQTHGQWPEMKEIPSAFSRVTNRIKKIGKRWSDRGLLRWLMLAMRKIFKPELWTQLWDQYLKINRKMELVMFKAEYTWL